MTELHRMADEAPATGAEGPARRRSARCALAPRRVVVLPPRRGFARRQAPAVPLRVRRVVAPEPLVAPHVRWRPRALGRDHERVEQRLLVPRQRLAEAAELLYEVLAL